mmetsp:Transcript_22336/g.63449  ORF Transcript_22336/g.63449 Transcript_22336/m.63449 type:complete len:202 (-) Transcript_22336:60-665(-)
MVCCCCSFRSCCRSNWSVVMSSSPCCFCSNSLNLAMKAAWESTFSSSSSTSRSNCRTSSLRNSCSSIMTPSRIMAPTCALEASSSTCSRMSAQPMSDSSTSMERNVCRVRSNFALRAPTSWMSTSRSTKGAASPPSPRGAPRRRSSGTRPAGARTSWATVSSAISRQTLPTSPTTATSGSTPPQTNSWSSSNSTSRSSSTP